METLILTLDTIALMVVLFFSYKGETAPGQPELGPFRIRARKPADPVAADGNAPSRAVRRR